VIVAIIQSNSHLSGANTIASFTIAVAVGFGLERASELRIYLCGIYQIGRLLFHVHVDRYFLEMFSSFLDCLQEFLGGGVAVIRSSYC